MPCLLDRADNRGMEVKLVARTLDLFELFANESKPLSLTEIARGLDVPMSSTLALVRTLASKGYLYETRKRSGYYPTRKMLLSCRAIDSGDVLLEAVRPHLEELRDQCNETIVLGRRQDTDIVYLDVLPSRQAIRYTATVGELRPLASNSIGKALFAALDAEEQKKLVTHMKWNKLTSSTITNAKRMLAEAVEARSRGWASNVAESVEDLAAIAMPVSLAAEWYGVSIVGPLERMERHWDRHVKALAVTLEKLKNAVGNQPADTVA